MKTYYWLSFQSARSSPDHMTQGHGVLKFRLVNMRGDIVLGFFTGCE